METKWHPSYFAKLFTQANWIVEAKDNFLLINHSKIDLEEPLKITYKSGLIWAALKIQTKDIELSLSGLPRKLGFELATVLNEIPKFSSAKALLEKYMLREKYFRHLDVNKINSLIQAEPNFKKINKLDLLKKSFPKFLNNLDLIINLTKNNTHFIANWNDEFVKKEKIKFQSFFNEIESTPLTEEQVVASIIMEDNNLVIASAGSGKTSVLIAKTGYAIKKGYANSDEILILSFNNAVKSEIKDRLNERLGFADNGINCPDIDTFHGFGNKILKESNINKRLAAWATTDGALTAQLGSIFQKLITSDKLFAKEAATFLTIFQGELEIEIQNICEQSSSSSLLELTKHSFGSVSSDAITLHRTLSGDTVRSYQEMRIANWLTIHGIDFHYEKEFNSWTHEAWKGGYRPDFFYPQINCWHEHFGLNKFGKAPEHWASKEKSYEQIAEDKRRLLKETGVKWFETTSANFDDYTWDEKLKSFLEKNGEQPEFIGWDKYSELTKGTPYSDDSLIKVLVTAIRHFKGNKLSIDLLKQKAQKQHNKKRIESFIKIFDKVFGEYEKLLEARGEIDFDDMLIIASDLIRAKKFINNYKLILIDEFQDISNVRAEMIQSLLQQRTDSILFAVGDDWQSIYRFAGADINVINEFSNIFGATKEVNLTTTFRCNQGIADVSSEFIQKNPAQKKKQVLAHTKGRNKSIRVIFHAGSPDSAIYSQLENLNDWAESKNKMISVCLLGRYKFSEPSNFTALAEKFKSRINLTFSTIHSVKGLGFDAVIVLGMTNKNGFDFPSSRQDDSVLSVFMPKSESLEFAEERRLFYVALTRAKTLVSLITPRNESSRFIKEILKSSHQDVIFSQEISDNEKYLVPAPIDAASQKLCPKCRHGRLLPRISKFGPWLVCENTNKNLCDYKKDGY